MIEARDRPRLQAIVADMRLDRVFTDLDYLVARLEEFSAAYAANAVTAPHEFPKTASIGDLLNEYDSNSYRVKALLQAVAFKCSPQMLAMMWMVELGADIAALNLQYRSREEFSLEVAIYIGYQDNIIEFKSTDVWDAAVLRFVGISKAGDSPLLDGFYPMRVS